MNDDLPTADAVAVRDGRIVHVGGFDHVIAELGPDAPYQVNDQLAENFVLPGLIDQHLHPLLAATTLATEVIATEDWVLPSSTFPAARSADEYDARLRAAVNAPIRLLDADDWLISWGFHELWHGSLSRERLDAISPTRPIGIWHRSCHEWFMNSAAIKRLNIAEAVLDATEAQGRGVDLERGHAWEAGFIDVLLPRLAPILFNEERMRYGLRQMVDYLHQNGVTAFNEPGIMWDHAPLSLYQEILGSDETPIRSTFIIYGRAFSAAGISAVDAVAEAEKCYQRLPEVGKLSLLRKQVKLFADGAIISQLMVMADPYLDHAGKADPHHDGEWLMEPGILRDYFRAFWHAGWQIHTHVNGDGALEILLDIISECQRDFPRSDHRSVIVHFANSSEIQIDRIAELGCLVSANPYYPVGFADKFGEHGLGNVRADQMVRSASVLARGIPLSFHSDLPMAPSDPLFLSSCAVNRVTPSGRVACPEQRISTHDALRAVTLEAAYSWRMEDELGSIEVGKVASFTVLAGDPFAADSVDLADIGIEGTVFEGRWFPIKAAGPGRATVALNRKSSAHLERTDAATIEGGGGGCPCHVAHALSAAYRYESAA